MTKIRKVVITGASIASPAGYSLAENYAAWRECRSNFVEITRFNTSGSSVRFAGECPEPDVKKLPDRKVQKILRRKDIISMLTTLACAEAAGVKKGDVDPERFGMYVGASCTQIGDLTPYFTLVAECADMHTGSFDSERFGTDLMTLVNPLVVLQTLMNNGLCFGTMTLDIRGVNSNFMDFQVAGLRAVGEAFRSIAYDRADLVIAGGIAGPVEPFQLAEGIRSGYLARSSELSMAPQEMVRPYDRARHGAVLSEGSAYMMLEEEQHAIRRGATILGRIDGFCLANDGMLDPASTDASRGLVRSINGAISEGGMKRQDLGMIVGHGNGSLFADGAEARSYHEFIADEGLPITSPKAVLGDMGEAGGVVSLILALETFATGAVPPTFNFKSGDDYSSRLAILDEPQECKHKRAVVTTRNFLGLSGSIALSEA